VDPLEELGEIALRERLWLHVDGAYGAMFALCEPGRTALRGMERADSLVLDPHKGLFMPCGSGAVLVRDGGALLRAYAYDAHYLQDEGMLAKDEISPSAHSPELTRPLRGLRIWLALKLLGVQPFRAALEEKMLLARYFHTRIQEAPGFEVGPMPDLSIVTFRYRPQRGDADEFNRRLTAAVQHDGRVFLSSTVIGGAHTLRVAVLSATTHKERIDVALEVLQEKARAIEEGE
jgi:glutamate/tyrosine decarboxylase-like PLP-dependent enzyme